MSKYGGIMYPAKGVSIGVTKEAYQSIETLRKAGFTSMKDIENLTQVSPEQLMAAIELFTYVKFNQMRRSNIVDYIFGDKNVNIFISNNYNDKVEAPVEEGEEANRKVIEDIISSTEEELRSVELYGDPDSAETRLTAAEYEGQIDGSKEVLSGRYKSDSSFIHEVTKAISNYVEQWEKENGRQFNYYDEANKEFLPSDDIDLLVVITYNQAYLTAFDIAYDTINK